MIEILWQRGLYVQFSCFHWISLPLRLVASKYRLDGIELRTVT